MCLDYTIGALVCNCTHSYGFSGCGAPIRTNPAVILAHFLTPSRGVLRLRTYKSAFSVWASPQIPWESLERSRDLVHGFEEPTSGKERA